MFNLTYEPMRNYDDLHTAPRGAEATHYDSLLLMDWEEYPHNSCEDLNLLFSLDDTSNNIELQMLNYLNYWNEQMNTSAYHDLAAI